MMILPIIQKGKVIHVSVSLPCKKIRKGLRCKGIEQSEIIVNRQKFSESSFSDSKDVKSTTDFIRTFSLLYPRKFLVVTSSDINSHLYDVYELNPPAEKVNDNLDVLYGKLITDLRKEIPGVVARGRYVSFRNLGFDDYFDESRIARLKMVVDNASDASLRTQLFQKEGVNDLVSFVDFLSDFKYTVLDDYSLNIDSLKEVLHTLSNINTRDYRNLKRYYEIAKTNTDILKKVSYVFEVVYDKPFTEERFFVKRKEKKRGQKMTIYQPHKFQRFEKLISFSNLEKLSEKSVLVLGCGGVGGYVCEALARSNIGTLILVDYDIVDITNINRQIIAMDSTIGKKKVDVLEERIHDINKSCKVIKIDQFIDDNNLDILFQNKIDFLVDACDTVSTKKAIIKKCLNKKIDFISSMGTGNKLDPSKLEIVDIRQTVNDPLARILRKFIKDEKINKKVMVLSSKELPIKTGDRTPGSTAFVPSSAGLLIASYVVKNFINLDN